MPPADRTVATAVATAGPASAADSGCRERVLDLAWPIQLVDTLRPLRHGRWDPTVQLREDGVWRATRTPAGVATVQYRPLSSPEEPTRARVLVRAWGPGAELELAQAERVLGDDDDPSGYPVPFRADAHPVMAAAHARHGAGWRAPRTGRVLESLVPAILEQRVTGLEATRAWAALVRAYGRAAPRPPDGPALMVAPDGPGWRRVPSWAWHRAGVDPGRARTIVAAADRAASLERLCDLPPAEAVAAIRSLPGIGGWTAAEVAIRAWGDVDSVSFGDFHLAGFVVHALTGALAGTDEQLAELLTPWAGQRARAVRMVELHCAPAPRRGPRATITDHRRR